MSLLIAIWLASLIVPESAAGHLQLDHEPLRKVLGKPHVAGLLLACFCMQASHGPYYAVYSIYMQSYDYSSYLTGWLWGIGVIAEVIVFLFIHRVFTRVSLRHLLIFSLSVAIVRWVLIASFPQHLWIMLFAQTLHAVTFGIYHVTAIQFIHQFFKGRHQGRGQALYSSLSFGAGGALGSFYSGFAWDYLGRSWVFGLSVVFAFLGLWVAVRYVRSEMV
jgi:PPP family 3-phenylpropionic acid transporter